MPQKKLVKIKFYDPDVGYENLWAVPVSKDRYRIESIPFFVYDISTGDVVAASPDAQGQLQFSKVVERSGNKTLRARSDNLLKSSTYRKKVIAELKKLSCEVEELRCKVLAIDVPANGNLRAVTNYLTNEAKIDWEYGNPQILNQ